MSIFKYEAEGEANVYRIMKDGNWFSIVRINGELHVPEQMLAMEKMVDALNRWMT